MNRIGRAVVILALGVVVSRLLWSGGFGFFVQQRMRLPLIGAAIVMVVFGVYEALAGSGEEGRDPEAARRPVGPAVGWLLVLPIVVLISVAPAGLGASAADRVEAYTPTDATATFEPLDDSAGPVDMEVFDFLDRAVWDDDKSLDGVTVRLEGLVVNDSDFTDGFMLTKFLVSCCAADGVPLQVAVHTDLRFDDDDWVVAEVLWREPDVPFEDQPQPWVIEADAVTLTVLPDAPNDPYESPY